MIVLDASAAVELLLRTSRGVGIARRFAASGQAVHAPHLLDVEVASVLRRQIMAGDITPQRGRRAMDLFQVLRLVRYPHTRLLPRVWELRHNLSAYDAVYVALAETLDAPLITCDARIAAAPGHGAQIEVV